MCAKASGTLFHDWIFHSWNPDPAVKAAAHLSLHPYFIASVSGLQSSGRVVFNLILTIHWWKSKFCGLGIAEVRFFQDSWVPSAWSVPLKRSEVMSADFFRCARPFLWGKQWVYYLSLICWDQKERCTQSGGNVSSFTASEQYCCPLCFPLLLLGITWHPCPREPLTLYYFLSPAVALPGQKQRVWMFIQGLL